mgnify:CR=1 FL=1
MNYFNSIPMRRQLEEIGHCRFMEHSEFSRGVEALKGKKIVFVGCGAQMQRCFLRFRSIA